MARAGASCILFSETDLAVNVLEERDAMNSENIISWTPANMITVVLMAALGFALLGAGIKAYQQFAGKKSS